jgi:hypothetical protein
MQAEQATQAEQELYQDRYYVGTYEGRPAVYDVQLGLRATGGTVQSMHDMMVGLARDDAWFANNPPQASTREHLMGGKYHGPSNEAGLTTQEYWEMQREWEDEQARIRDEW